jgi:hypothetical protein
VRVLTLRPTKKLARQLALDVPRLPVAVPSRVSDWCAHTFLRGNEPWLIFCNTASLYPVFAGSAGVTDGESLARRLGGMVLGVLQTNGFSTQAKIFQRELTGFQFAPIPDRSVLGSVSELIWLADAWFDDVDLTPATLSHKLGKTPMSALGMNRPADALSSLKA